MISKICHFFSKFTIQGFFKFPYLCNVKQGKDLKKNEIPELTERQVTSIINH